MNHAITIGGLLSAIAVLLGIVAAGAGLLTLFAAGMSTTGDEPLGRAGCIITVGGLVLVVSGVLWRIFG